MVAKGDFIPEDFEPKPRECDGCTRCCEGWLSAEALGKRFFPGQPCHWLSIGKGCTVYEDRPPVCTDFTCAWLSSHFLPEWFKPSDAAIICNWMRWKDLEDCKPEDRGGLYLKIVECGEPMNTNCMTWLNNYANAGLLNVRYQHHGRWHWIGNEEFSQWCSDGMPETTKPH